MNRDEQIRKELVRRHDHVLTLLQMSRAQRRSRGVRASRRDLERMLHAVGFAIAQTGE